MCETSVARARRSPTCKPFGVCRSASIALRKANLAKETGDADEELAQLEVDLKGKGVIRVHLKSGSELAAAKDSTHDGRADTSFPYVTMHMMGKEHHRSKMRKRTLNPKWDETFEFRGAHEHGGRPTLQSLLNTGLFLEVYNELP